MTEVAIEALRERFGDYLGRARKGEPILVTQGGRSVALLIPIEEGESVSRAWDLVQAGTASWSGGKPSGSRQRPRVRGRSVSATVLEDRR